MLERVGDILNWTTAGILFPVMLLPLAALLSSNRAGGGFAYLMLCVGVVAAGSAFAAFVPVLRAEPDIVSLAIFSGLALGVGVIVFFGGGVARFTGHLSVALEWVTRGAGRAVMWLLLAMAFVQFAVVLLRYVFGVNSLFMQESITYMHGAVFLLAAGYALVTNDHVRVDIFYRDAAPKRKALIDLLGTYLLLFPVCLTILWTASPYLARSWLVMEGSADASGIQGVFLLKSLIPAFAVLLSMAGFVVAQRAVETLKGKDA